MSARRLHPSDLMSLSWNATATKGTYRPFSPDTPAFLDTQDDSNRWGRFVCTVKYEGTREDTRDDRWTVTTQGYASGGRRYRYGLSLNEAQEVALAWLDRRFRVPQDSVSAVAS